VQVIASVSRNALIRRITYLPTGNVKQPGSETTDHAASNKETSMASRGKKKTTFAKLNRETKLRERRAEKEARKQARRLEAESGEFDSVPEGEFETVPAGPLETAPDEV
jgi:hypothetical protein